MATLRANGEVLVEMTVARERTDGAEADPMRLVERIVYRAMSSGFMLKKTTVTADYGTGGTPRPHSDGWKRMPNRIKAELLADKAKLFEAMQLWCDNLRAKGWDAELT